MTFDEFLATLDRENPYFDDVVMTFEDDFRKGVVIIESKSRRLPEVVEQCKAERLFPVVDKKLGLLFGCETHGLPRQELFRYHYYAGGRDRPHVDPYESQDRWVSEGHGWFISKMRPQIIVAGINYRPDQFDKDVFTSYEIDHQDVSREEKLAIIRGDRRFR